MTSQCTDPRFEKQLYAYELGMLEESEREALELHLLECEHCFKRVESFAPTAGLLRDSAAVRDLVARQGGETPAYGAPVGRAGDRRPARSLAIRLSLLAAAVFVILVLKPWQFEFRPTHEAVATENRLAVLRFDNLTRPDDPDRLGEIVSRLLVTDLSESSQMQVVSSQRIQDIERLLNDTSEPGAASERALEIARQARARWLLTGDVFETDAGLRLSLQIIDVGTGVVQSSNDLAARSGESVFALVDRVSEVVRTDLSLPGQAGSEANRPVSQVTTESAEAYRHYIDGIEFVGQYYAPEAVDAFNRAVALDSTFAMAYYYLAIYEDPKLISRAVEFSRKASWVEQRYIAAYAAQIDKHPEQFLGILHEILERFPDEKDACYRLGEYYWQLVELDSAVTYFRRAVAIDPLFRTAWNTLAYAYSRQEDLDRAIEAMNNYIDLAPGEANPYDSRGDLYAFNGNTEQAAESYQRALAIKSDYWTSALNLAAMRVFQGRYGEADSLFDRLESVDRIGVRTMAHLYRPSILVRQGKLNAGLAELARRQERARRDLQAAGDNGERPSFYEFRARVLLEQKKFDQALAALDTAIAVNNSSRPEDDAMYENLRAQYFALAGDFGEAERIRDRLAALPEVTGTTTRYPNWAGGAIELARHNPAAAVEQLKKAAAMTTITGSFITFDLLARAYLEAGDLGQAVPLFERLTRISTKDRLTNIIEIVKVHYYLGIAYEESRWYDRAAEEYQTFLEIWKDADSGLSSVEDARARLARLRS